MDTPTISSSRPRPKRISVTLGARETILFGGKGKVNSLPTSSINVWVAEKDVDVPLMTTRNNKKSDLMN
jgi:hypothetical protein